MKTNRKFKFCKVCSPFSSDVKLIDNVMKDISVIREKIKLIDAHVFTYSWYQDGIHVHDTCSLNLYVDKNMDNDTIFDVIKSYGFDGCKIEIKRCRLASAS